ncbi:MAG: efflux RND transporter periplasmic adaptor subunit [Reyranella sp.]|nr:efflux RND transporter periplasmic adaptor subunit [Reyranella sp.]
MKHAKALAAVVLLVAASGGAYWYFRAGPGKGTDLTVAGINLAPSSPAAPAAAASPPRAAGANRMPPLMVEATKPRIGESRQTVTAVGTFRSNESVTLRPELASRVKSINFEEGQKVTRGQVLVQLDAAIEEATVAQAKAAYELSKANNERQKVLGARQIAAERSVDEARAALLRDEAAVKLAQARLEKFTLIAPWDGVAGLRKVSVGAYINAGQEIVNIEQIDPLKVDFRVPENFLAAVRVGQAIAVTADAFPGKEFIGKVYAIDPQVDEQGRAVVVRALIDNSSELMRPGVFARVTLTLNVRDNAMFIPEQALVPIGNKHSVYKIVDGRTRIGAVEIGRRQSGEVEILSGLEPDDVVVTAGQIKLRNGTPVQVVGKDFQPGGRFSPPPASPTPGAAGK